MRMWIVVECRWGCEWNAAVNVNRYGLQMGKDR